MSLYVVQHKHSDATCPARNPEMGGKLLSHLSPDNAKKFGVTIRSEAVIDGAHTMYLILEASDQKRVVEFMAPFKAAGSVDVLPASHCETVVGRGSC